MVEAFVLCVCACVFLTFLAAMASGKEDEYDYLFKGEHSIAKKRNPAAHTHSVLRPPTMCIILLLDSLVHIVF